MYAVRVYFFYLKTAASCSISAALGRCFRSTPKINLRNSFVSFVAWEGKCFPGMTDRCPWWPPPCQVSTVKRRCITLRQISESKISLIAMYVHIFYFTFYFQRVYLKLCHSYTCQGLVTNPRQKQIQTSLITDLKNWHFWKPLFMCHVIQATQCCAFSAVGCSLVPKAVQFSSAEGI